MEKINLASFIYFRKKLGHRSINGFILGFLYARSCARFICASKPSSSSSISFLVFFHNSASCSVLNIGPGKAVQENRLSGSSPYPRKSRYLKIYRMLYC